MHPFIGPLIDFADRPKSPLEEGPHPVADVARYTVLVVAVQPTSVLDLART